MRNMNVMLNSTLSLSLVCVTSAGALLLLGPESARGAEGDIDEIRIREIAPMLTDQPASFGRPITDRAAWDSLAESDAFAGVIARAEALLDDPIPDLPDDLFLDFSRTGNRSRWQRVNSRRDGRVNSLVLAECIENKGRFVPAFEELARAFASERTWMMPAHDRSLTNFNGESIDIDLKAASRGCIMATALYLLGDKLSDETQKLIRDEVSRRILVPFRDMAEGKRKRNWWMTTTNNWNAVCLGGVTGSALALLESREERAFFVAAAEEYSKNFLRGFTADGYCSEGLGYWNYGFGDYLMLCEIIHQATGGKLDLLARDEVRAPATFGARIEIINGVYPAFADCSITVRPGSRQMYFVSRRFGLGLRKWEDRNVASPSGRLYECLMYSFPSSASQTPVAERAAEGPDLRDWFEQAGIMIGRPAPGSDCRMAVALKGGHNGEHHNHNDVGSYVVVVGSQAVLLDPGGETYTARTFSSRRYESNLLNSFGHAVPVVAGQLQQKGREARAEVLRADLTDDADTLVLDLKAAYAVEELQKLERTFVYSRADAGSLTVKDEVAFTTPQTFGTALITLGEWREVEPGAILIYDFEGAVRVDIETEGADFEIVAEEIKEDARAQPTRLGINFKSPVTSATITVKITPIALDDQDGKSVRNGDFEKGTWGWRIPKGGMGALSTEQAAGGQYSLKITDASKTEGSSINSARIRADGAGAYELRGNYFPVSGDGVGMYVKYLDESGRVLNQDDRGWLTSTGNLGGSEKRWAPFAFRFETPAETAALQIWIHSYTGSTVEGYLDDLEIVKTNAR